MPGKEIIVSLTPRGCNNIKGILFFYKEKLFLHILCPATCTLVNMKVDRKFDLNTMKNGNYNKNKLQAKFTVFGIKEIAEILFGIKFIKLISNLIPYYYITGST